MLSPGATATVLFLSASLLGALAAKTHAAASAVEIVLQSPPWLPDFGSSSSLARCPSCRIVPLPQADARTLARADALLFPAVTHDGAFPASKPAHQLWISMCTESKTWHCQKLSNPRYRARFDLFANYSLDSDVPGVMAALSEQVYRQPVPAKTEAAPAVWISSNCRPEANLFRNRFVAELMQHIRVDSYGACLHNRNESLEEFVDAVEVDAEHKSMYRQALAASRKSAGGGTSKGKSAASKAKAESASPAMPLHPICEQQGIHSQRARAERHYALAGRYLFYLGLENAREQWYVTEKLWTGYRVGALPVYWGSPRARELAPPHSFIDAAAFPTARDLAKYLKRLAKNRTEYDSYFAWKTQPIPETTRRMMALGGYGFDGRTGGGDWECRICEAVRQRRDAARKQHKT